MSDSDSDFIKGKYEITAKSTVAAGQNIQIIAKEVRDGVGEVAKRLTDTFGVSSTPYSQPNIGTEKGCLASSVDVRVTVNVIDLFTLFLNRMIKTATDHGQLSTIERTSANYYSLDADAVQYWLYDGVNPQVRGDDFIANVVYEFIKSSPLSV